MSYICPTCNKELKTKKSLARHTEKYHAGEPAPPGTPEPEPGNKPEPLEIVKPPEGAGATYECGDCGHEIKQGDKTCSGCGGELVWS